MVISMVCCAALSFWVALSDGISGWYSLIFRASSVTKAVLIVYRNFSLGILALLGFLFGLLSSGWMEEAGPNFLGIVRAVEVICEIGTVKVVSKSIESKPESFPAKFEVLNQVWCSLPNQVWSVEPSLMHAAQPSLKCWAKSECLLSSKGEVFQSLKFQTCLVKSEVHWTSDFLSAPEAMWGPAELSSLF